MTARKHRRDPSPRFSAAESSHTRAASIANLVAGPSAEPALSNAAAISQSAVNRHERIRIAVAGEAGLFRELLCGELQRKQTLLVIGAAATEGAIGDLLVREHPDVLVFDYDHPAPHAETMVRHLRCAVPATRILVLASASSDENVQRMLRAGASGFVPKQHALTALVRAIHAVAEGEIWASRRAISEALEDFARSSDTPAKLDLTRRELEIAEACGHGLRNKEIAARLYISEKTVKGHLNNIFRKLHVGNRLALALEVAARMQGSGTLLSCVSYVVTFIVPDMVPEIL